MIKNKKITILIVFTLSFLVFVTSAFAEITLGNGYIKLKDSAKKTVLKTENDFKSYTVTTEGTLKNGNDTLVKVNMTEKKSKDNQNESIKNTTIKDFDKIYSYSYNDEKVSINSFDGEKFSVYNKTNPNIKTEIVKQENQFETQESKDIEKIVDALVGNLSNHVIYKENKDGTKTISGSLNENQIPSYINAGVSFLYNRQFKYTIMDHRDINEEKLDNLLLLKTNIFIDKVNAKISLNKDNIIEKIVISSEIVGKDKNNIEKKIDAEYVMLLKDIDKTFIEKPDLKNKEVTEEVHEATKIDKKYIGKWKKDILKVKENKFVKSSEKILEIKKIENNIIYTNLQIINYEDKSKNKSYAITFKKNETNEYTGKLVIDDKELSLVLHSYDNTISIFTYENSESQFNGDYNLVFNK